MLGRQQNETQIPDDTAHQTSIKTSHRQCTFALLRSPLRLHLSVPTGGACDINLPLVTNDERAAKGDPFLWPRRGLFDEAKRGWQRPVGQGPEED